MRHRLSLSFLAAFCLCGCPTSGTGDAGDAGDAGDLGLEADAPGDALPSDTSGDVSGDLSSDAPPTVAIGDPCDADPPLSQGTCSTGQLCLPFPGGYCTQFCQGTRVCPTGSRCVPTVVLGEACFRTCTMDTDCGMGQVCDPAFSVCLVPSGLVQPRLRACTASVPARRSFGPVTQLSTTASPGRFSFEPAGAVTADGSFVVVYTAGTDHAATEQSMAVAVVRPDGTVGVRDRALRSTLRFLFDPWMASDASGRVHLVFLEHGGNGPSGDVNPRITYMSSTDGSTWSTAREVSDAAADCPMGRNGCFDKPMIAIGPDPMRAGEDLLHVGYSAARGETTRRSLDRGATFESSRLAPFSFYGDLEAASDGSLHAVAVRLGGTLRSPASWGSTLNRIELRRSADRGDTWSGAIVASSSGESIPAWFSNPQVAHDVARGLTYVAYIRGTPDGVWDVVLATSRDGGTSWSRTRVNDDAPCANHMIAQLALDPMTGRVHVGWIDNRDGRGRAMYAECASGGASCMPNEAVSDTPFAAYELGRHTLTWPGEYNAFVLDSTRRVLHFAWTQAVTESGVLVSRIFYARRSL